MVVYWRKMKTHRMPDLVIDQEGHLQWRVNDEGFLIHIRCCEKSVFIAKKYIEIFHKYREFETLNESDCELSYLFYPKCLQQPTL
jgi:hypothetical protein